MKMTTFWDVTPCNLVKIHQYFQRCTVFDACFLLGLIFGSEARSSKFFRNTGGIYYIPEDSRLHRNSHSILELFSAHE
jgi:hypothetical protein